MHLAAVTTFTFLLSAAAMPSGGDSDLLCRPPCGSGQVCLPNRTQDNRLFGVCVTPSGRCGGIVAAWCENPLEKCIDDPRDNCGRGASDCVGICVPK